jgi:ankyrin repeat protein
MSSDSDDDYDDDEDYESDRPTSRGPPKSYEERMAELEEESGQRFDPRTARKRPAHMPTAEKGILPPDPTTVEEAGRWATAIKQPAHLAEKSYKRPVPGDEEEEGSEEEEEEKPAPSATGKQPPGGEAIRRPKKASTRRAVAREKQEMRQLRVMETKEKASERNVARLRAIAASRRSPGPQRPEPLRPAETPGQSAQRTMREIIESDLSNAEKVPLLEAHIRGGICQLGQALDPGGPTVLCAAVIANSGIIVDMLLRSGATTTAGAADTPLWMAANLGREMIARRLLRGGADPNVGSGKTGERPLHRACMPPTSVEREAVAVVLIENRAGSTPTDINARVPGTYYMGYTPLMLAVHFGLNAAVAAFVRAGVDIEAALPASSAPAAPAAGTTALSLAARFGREDALRLLLASRAKIDVPGVWKHLTLLGAACEGGSAGCVAALLAAGLKPDEPGPSGRTPLMIAANRGNVGIAKLLLSKGANPKATTKTGDTALHFACLPEAGRSIELVRILLASGCDPMARVDGGTNSLHVACLFDFPAAVAEFAKNLKSGDWEVADDTGRTPLHCAATDGGFECAMLLAAPIAPGESALAVSRRLTARDREGYSPLGRACCSDSSSAVARVLAAAGAGLRLASNEGLTPLHAACLSNSVDAMRQLIRADGDVLEDRVPDTGDTAAHVAAMCADPGPIVLLCSIVGAAADAQNDVGHTPLHVAASRGNARVAGTMVMMGFDAFAASGDGTFPIECASDDQTYEAMRVAMVLRYPETEKRRLDLSSDPEEVARVAREFAELAGMRTVIARRVALRESIKTSALERLSKGDSAAARLAEARASAMREVEYERERRRSAEIELLAAAVGQADKLAREAAEAKLRAASASPTELRMSADAALAKFKRLLQINRERSDALPELKARRGRLHRAVRKKAAQYLRGLASQTEISTSTLARLKNRYELLESNDALDNPEKTLPPHVLAEWYSLDGELQTAAQQVQRSREALAAAYAEYEALARDADAASSAASAAADEAERLAAAAAEVAAKRAAEAGVLSPAAAPAYRAGAPMPTSAPSSISAQVQEQAVPQPFVMTLFSQQRQVIVVPPRLARGMPPSPSQL